MRSANNRLLPARLENFISVENPERDQSEDSTSQQQLLRWCNFVLHNQGGFFWAATKLFLVAIKLVRWVQGRNEVRWRPGQEASSTPPCSNLRSFGSKCTVLKKIFVTLLGLFGALLAPLGTPLDLLTRVAFYAVFSRSLAPVTSRPFRRRKPK